MFRAWTYSCFSLMGCVVNVFLEVSSSLAFSLVSCFKSRTFVPGHQVLTLVWRPCFWLTDHTLLLWGVCPPLRATWDRFTVLNFSREIPILSLIILLGFPFTSFLGFFNSRSCLHSLRDSNTKALGDNSSLKLQLRSFAALRQSLLSAKPALCVPLSGCLVRLLAAAAFLTWCILL